MAVPLTDSRVAQWKRAGPITQRSVDRNYALLSFFSLRLIMMMTDILHPVFSTVRMAEWSKAPDSRHSLASFIGSIVENSGPRMRAWVQIPLLTKSFVDYYHSTTVQNVYNIAYSQAVTHPSTNATRCCLTSVIGRELVLST